MQSAYKTAFVVFNIVFAAGVTPILIRYAQGAGVPSLVIVFIRLWLVTIALFPLIWIRYKEELFALTRRQIMLITLGGFWSALNLLMLFFALEYTSVLITSVLRRTTPLWIILPEIFLLGAVFSRRIWWSLLITFIGAILIALAGNSAIELGSQPLLGAGIAIFGAICFGIYLLIGRQLTNAMPSLLYSWSVFLSASVFITIFVLITQTPIFGYSTSGYLWALAVTFVAQVMGQLGILIGLQRFSATAMAIIVQVGVVVSAIIAVFTFNEIPTLWQLVGSLLVIVGVILATIEQNERKTHSASIS